LKDLKVVFNELEKHRERLVYSKKKIESWNRIDEKILQNPEKVETIDSFIFRFSKLQDSMGEKLFPLTLEFLGEEVRNKPFIDILNRLERLELIESAQKWKELRELRNILTHTYPWETEIIIDTVKIALKKSEELIRTLDKFKDFLKARGLEIK
jgi:uncharacterized protein with HEPN domain